MIERKICVAPTVLELAHAFSELDTDEQHSFFFLIGKHSEGWNVPSCFQWHEVGRKMRDAKDDTSMKVISDIYDAMKEDQ